jgi:uncharacterized protein GlcG (DUF336 family)
MKIPHPVVHLLGSIAEERAWELGIPMSIAIVDETGGLRLFSRMDGALPASTELAVSKAFTSAVLRMASHEVGALSQPGGVLYGIQETHGGRIVLFGGGLPLWLRGKGVGAVGVSGGTVEQDVLVARSVVEALEGMEEWSSTVVGFPGFGEAGEIPPIPSLTRRLREEFERIDRLISDELLDLLVGGALLALSRNAAT